MENSKAYIESGILEFYVLGLSTKQENKKVIRMSEYYQDIGNEIDQIVIAMEKYVYLNKVTPGAFNKHLVMSVIKKD